MLYLQVGHTAVASLLNLNFQTQDCVLQRSLFLPYVTFWIFWSPKNGTPWMTKTPPKKKIGHSEEPCFVDVFWGCESRKLLEGIGINVMYKARKSWAWPARRGAPFSKNQGWGKLGRRSWSLFSQQLKQKNNIHNNYWAHLRLALAPSSEFSGILHVTS